MMKSTLCLLFTLCLNVYSLQSHNIWQRGLYESLDNTYVSVFGTFHNLMHSNILTYTLENNFTHFNNLLCGLIKSSPKLENRWWWINQKAAITLKWDSLNFMVYRDSVECSASYVEWMENQETSRWCGYRLPWQQYSGGNITITKKFIVSLKQSSSITFLYHITSYRKYIKFPFVMFAKLVQISPPPNHRIYNLDVRLYMSGSSPLQILSVNVSPLKGTRMENFALYDGPYELCPKLLPYANETDIKHQITSNLNESWVTNTSSFLALLVVNVIKRHVAGTWSVTWSSNDAEVIDNTCTLNPRGVSCISNSSQNGLVHLNSISNHLYRLTHGILIDIIYFEYLGPDTFSSNMGLCQYGGLWIYGTNNEDFSKKTNLFQHCSEDQILDMKLYSSWQYIIIALVQYNEISISMVEYQIKLHQLERKNIRFYANRDQSGLQTWAIDAEVEVLQILTYMKHFASAQFTNASNKPFELIFRYHSLENQCSCQVEIYSKHDWCSIQQKSLYMKLTASAVDEDYRIWDGIKPINFTIHCTKCKVQPFIYFLMTSASSYKTYLGSYFIENNYVIFDSLVTCRVPLEQYVKWFAQSWDIWLQNSHYTVANISINLSVRQTAYFRVTNLWLNVQIHECYDNTIQLTTYTIKPREYINHFTQSTACLISVTKGGQWDELYVHGSYKLTSIDVFVNICPVTSITNSTLEKNYWTPMTTER